MRLQVASAAVAFTLVVSAPVGAQQVVTSSRGLAPMVAEAQPLRRAISDLGSASTQWLTRQAPRGPINGKKCLRAIGISTAIIGAVVGAAFASEAKEEDRWKVAGTAALRVGVPAGVASGLAICTR